MLRNVEGGAAQRQAGVLRNVGRGRRAASGRAAQRQAGVLRNVERGAAQRQAGLPNVS
ncbi:MAG TPA: hypothetical protein VGD71_13105 [Kribbella sp.]